MNTFELFAFEQFSLQKLHVVHSAEGALKRHYDIAYYNY